MFFLFTVSHLLYFGFSLQAFKNHLGGKQKDDFAYLLIKQNILGRVSLLLSIFVLTTAGVLMWTSCLDTDIRWKLYLEHPP